MTGIKIDNCKDVTLQGNKFFGFENAIEATNSEDIKVIDNFISKDSLDDPIEFIKTLELSPKIQEEIDKAKKGNDKSKAFLQSIAEKVKDKAAEKSAGAFFAYIAYLIGKGLENLK